MALPLSKLTLALQKAEGSILQDCSFNFQNRAKSTLISVRAECLNTFVDLSHMSISSEA